MENLNKYILERLNPRHLGDVTKYDLEKPHPTNIGSLKWQWPGVAMATTWSITLENSWCGVVYFNKKNKAPVLVFCAIGPGSSKVVFYSLGNWYCIAGDPKFIVKDIPDFFKQYSHSFEKVLKKSDDYIRNMVNVSVPVAIQDTVDEFDRIFKI